VHSDFHCCQLHHHVEDSTVEILTGLLIFGAVIYLLPYILAGAMAILAIFVGIIALFVAGVKKIF
jgi:VIT1/CCC1 family predicted Fe2+/Mn2+ transporter